MNEQNRRATDLSRRRFLTNTVAGLAAASAVRERTSLPATIKVVKAARTAKNFRSFSWIGYEVFRENGYLPIVIGDACDCKKPEEEPAALRRICNFFAPVISSDSFVKLLQPAAPAAQR